MIIVSCPQDPKSFAEFECLLDAEIYYEVARESLPPYMQLVMTTTADLRPCGKTRCGCNRKFVDLVH